MLDALRQIEKRGALEMAERQGQVYDKTFRYAIAIGVADNDSLHSLRGALKQNMNGHHAAITPEELPEFIRVLKRSRVTCSLGQG